MVGPLFITGGTGNVGRRLLARLDVRQPTVCLVRRPPDPPLPLHIRLLRGTLSLLPQIAHRIPTNAIFLHLAGCTHARSRHAYVRVNVDGTRAVLTAAKKRACRHFIFVSTRAIDPTGGWYSQSKREAEELVRASGLPSTILRPAELLGAGPEGLDRMWRAAQQGRPIFLPGDGADRVAPLHVEDLIRVLKKTLAAKPMGKTLTITGGSELSLREFVDRVQRHAHASSPIIPLPFPIIRLIAFLAQWIPILPISPDQPSRLQSPKATSTSEVVARYHLGISPLRFFE